MVKLRTPVWSVGRESPGYDMFRANLPQVPQELRRDVFDAAGAIKVMDEPDGMVERISNCERTHGFT
jgi:hypothetical protein